MTRTHLLLLSMHGDISTRLIGKQLRYWVRIKLASEMSDGVLAYPQGAQRNEQGTWNPLPDLLYILGATDK